MFSQGRIAKTRILKLENAFEESEVSLRVEEAVCRMASTSRFIWSNGHRNTAIR